MRSTSLCLLITILVISSASNSTIISLPYRSDHQALQSTNETNSTVNYETKIEISVPTAKLSDGFREKLAAIVYEGIIYNWANHLNSTVDALNITQSDNVRVKIVTVEYGEDIAEITFISYWNDNPIPAKIVTRDLAQLNLNRIAETLGYPVHKITTYSPSESILQKWWIIVLIAACGFVMSILGFFIIFLSLNCNQTKGQLFRQNQHKVHAVYSSSCEPRRSDLMELSVQNDHEFLNKPSQLASDIDHKYEKEKKTDYVKRNLKKVARKKKKKSEFPLKSVLVVNTMQKDNAAIDKWNVPDMRFEKSYVRREDRPKTAATVRKSAHVLDDIELHGTGGDGHFNPYFAADKAHEIMCKIMGEDTVDALEINGQHPKPTYFLAKNDLYMD